MPSAGEDPTGSPDVVRTKKDTVNLALRDFAARHQRVATLEHFARLAADWDFTSWERLRATEKDPAA